MSLKLAAVFFLALILGSAGTVAVTRLIDHQAAREGDFKLAAEIPLVALSGATAGRDAWEKTFSEEVKPREALKAPEREGIVSVHNAASAEEKDVAPASCLFETGAAPLRAPVILNEVAWMGTRESPNHEWIELKNPGAEEASLQGWSILDKGGDIRVVLGESHRLSPGKFLLFERGSDVAVPFVSADAVYNGTLSNREEGLRLFDAGCRLVDEFLASPEWPAGVASPDYRTAERLPDLTWHTHTGSGEYGMLGTPKRENSLPIPPSSPLPPVAPPDAASEEPPPSSSDDASSPPPPPAEESAAGLNPLISEIFIDMEGADTGEFIELYNPNGAAVDLSRWSLQYLSGGASSFSSISKKNFVSGATIPAHGFYLTGVGGYTGSVAPDMTWSQSLHNTGATVFFVNDTAPIPDASDAHIVDRVAYGTGMLHGEGGAAPLPPPGQSIERKASGCISSQGGGENSGNGCDTGSNANDFEIRSAPDPENSQSPREP